MKDRKENKRSELLEQAIRDMKEQKRRREEVLLKRIGLGLRK